ncbi:MAG: hypothetical protein ACYC3X_27325 [Pirellulaceae bacterium]
MMAFLQEGQSYSLILGLFLLAGILAEVPTRRSLDSWLERQQRQIQEIRDLAGLR